jgi:osmotically-inducible protein OsmY
MPAKLCGRIVIGLFGSLLVVPAAFGQQQGSGGSSSPFGSGSTQTQTGSQGMQGTSTGGVGYTSGSSAAPGSSSTPIGLNSLMNNGNNGTNGGANNNAASSGTYGRSGNRSISGRGRTNTTTGLQGLNAGNTGRNLTQGNQQQNNRQTGNRAQYTTQMAFTGAPSQSASTLQIRESVGESLRSVAVGTSQVTVDGSTVILQGTVASAEDRKLAERMAMLEPGVKNVRNELVVKSE